MSDLVNVLNKMTKGDHKVKLVTCVDGGAFNKQLDRISDSKSKSTSFNQALPHVATFRTNSGKSSIRYICPSTWNLTLKELSMKNI